MIDYIKGKVVEINPTEIILETNGFGYRILISLQTYKEIKGGDSNITIYIYHHLREDEELFFGFHTKEEREIFKQLISVSGIGSNTARMMLSSLSSQEIITAITEEDTIKIKSIKGIGLKTARRVILELKDRFAKSASSSPLTINNNSYILAEATNALQNLGFSKQSIDKVLQKVVTREENLSLEQIIKESLRLL